MTRPGHQKGCQWRVNRVEKPLSSTTGSGTQVATDARPGSAADPRLNADIDQISVKYGAGAG
jgi:hypothetical protein